MHLFLVASSTRASVAKVVTKNKPNSKRKLIAVASNLAMASMFVLSYKFFFLEWSQECFWLPEEFLVKKSLVQKACFFVMQAASGFHFLCLRKLGPCGEMPTEFSLGL